MARAEVCLYGSVTQIHQWLITSGSLCVNGNDYVLMYNRMNGAIFCPVVSIVNCKNNIGARRDRMTE